MLKLLFAAILLLGVGVLIGLGLGSQSVKPAGERAMQRMTEADSAPRQSDLEPARDKVERLAQRAAEAPLNLRQAIKTVVEKPTQFEQFAAAYILATPANQTELGQMIDILMAMESQPASIGIARIFYDRFVNLDPQQAIAHFWRTVPEDSSQYQRIMYHLYHEWAWIDMAQALANIIAEAPAPSIEGIIGYLLRDDHFRDSDILLQTAQNYSEQTRAEALLASLNNEPFTEAFERLMALPKSSSVRRQGLFRLARRWAKEDPQAALALIQQMTGADIRSALLNSVIEVWAQTDPEQALLAAIGLGKRGNYGFSALSALTKKDGIRALELARQYGEKLDRNITNQLLQSWASYDVKAAAAYLESQGRGTIRNDARQILWHYAQQYPEEAYLWVERMGLQDEASVASNMGSALVQTDLAKAEAIFDQLPASASRNDLFSNIVRQRSRQDIEQTYKWLSQYRNEPKYKEAQRQVMFEWAREDPQRVIEIVQSMEAGSERAGYLASAAHYWYERSADEAQRWAMSLAPGFERDRVLVSVAQKMANTDLDGALYLLDQVGDEQLRQRVTEQLYARHLSN